MPLERHNLYAHAIPFSHIVLDGEYAHVSGQLAQDPVTRQVKAGTAEWETNACMTQLKAILATKNLTLSDITRVNLYITDLTDFVEINKAYAQFFPDGAFPARTCVQVSGLIGGTRIEIEATARLPKNAKM
ncbi:Endoribonuclease L-PSP/chorismate mutase-like protein [Chytriomyces sp. MP71]|nr:Endoribonuclease L-PSP/chorismate mutase-like protein [Chytriomyces sp. MP71]